tara:strand:- start:258 stop:1067 length:810 start_codon:yes stop_codon:yes gene_type:complete
MEIAFTKMHGAGNDFVMIENLDGSIELSTEQVARMCDRRFGIGADGLILLNPPQADDTDATMIYYNADGGRVDMCGNGARCFTSFALQNGVGNDESISFLTDAGPMKASASNGLFTINMTPVHSIELDQKLDTEHGSYNFDFMNTGVEHVVVFSDAIDRIDIVPEGSAIRYQSRFPNGTNVNFAEIQNDGVIKVRTYERGVEGETLACGTGVTAVAIAANLTKNQQFPISVLVRGGDTLSVDFHREGDDISNITLTGPAKIVFRGQIQI